MMVSLSALDFTEIGGFSPFSIYGYSPLSNRVVVLIIL